MEVIALAAEGIVPEGTEDMVQEGPEDMEQESVEDMEQGAAEDIVPAEVTGRMINTAEVQAQGSEVGAEDTTVAHTVAEGRITATPVTVRTVKDPTKYSSQKIFF